MERLCPFNHPTCRDNCKLNMNGECAFVVLAKAATKDDKKKTKKKTT